MKIAKQQLKQIIKEEISKVLSEQPLDPSPAPLEDPLSLLAQGVLAHPDIQDLQNNPNIVTKVPADEAEWVQFLNLLLKDPTGHTVEPWLAGAIGARITDAAQEVEKYFNETAEVNDVVEKLIRLTTDKPWRAS